MESDSSVAAPSVRPVPVAYVSQLGTSFVEPGQSPRFTNPETATQGLPTASTASSTTTSTTMPSLPIAEIGQGDGAHHSSPSSIDSLHRSQPSTSSAEFRHHDELLGAVGGAPISEENLDVSSSSSSRVPHLHIPHLDTSLLSEPLRPQYAYDRPLSPPVPVAEVEDQANQIIQGFFEERWRQESSADVGDDVEGQSRGELVLPGGGVGLTRPPSGQPPNFAPAAADAADGGGIAASMLHPDAARRRNLGAAAGAPGEDKIKAVSSKLCMIAAEMDQRYSVEFDDMIDLMKLNGSTAYDAFAEVAKQLLSDKITWGKVITLLALGYRMAKRVIDLAIPSFVQNIISYLTTFICRYVAKWIADRGGWFAILNLEEGISWTGVFGIMSVGCAVLAALSWLKNR